MKKQDKTIKMKKTTMSGVQSSSVKQEFTHEELLKALMNVEDWMDQLLTPFFLFGKVAECVKRDRLLEGDGIDVGIRDKSLTQYVYDILNTNFKLKPEDVNHGFEYKVGEVPVRVKVYSRNYHFFKYPDIKIYQFGQYQLPNPFDIYWKSRFLIR